jgi:tyrosyl-tRNA synthetase
MSPIAPLDSAAKARLDLITDNLAEVLNPELIEKVLAEGRNPRIYWGNETKSSSQVIKRKRITS